MVSRVERHLCVIFAADVAGYSTLMRRDEEGTLAQLVTARQKMDDLVAGHRGRIVNSVGDSVLAEFSSVMDAIQAAIEIQRELDTAAAATPADKRVRFRIGLQLGEVMVRSTDIYGDGVNVAARLQTLADPGGIVVSGTVYDQLRDRLAIPFVDLGEQSVKNIERPVPAFGLTPDAIAALPKAATTVPDAVPGHRRSLLVATAAALVLAAGATAWWAWHAGAVPPLRAEAVAPGPGTGNPQSGLLPMSLAIAPLVVIPSDVGAARFAESFRRDLSTGLRAVERRVTLLSIVAADEAKLPGAARESARRVGVRYVLEGDVRSQGESELVNLQLVDTEKGVQSWSGQLQLRDGDASIDAMVVRRQLIKELHDSVAKAETQRVLALPLERLTATELVVRWEVRVQCESYLLLGQAAEAIQSCERASGLDPGDWIVQLFLVAAYANSGDLAKAADAERSVLKAVPGYTIATLRAKRYSEVPAYLKLAETYWYGGLRKAGMPEQ